MPALVVVLVVRWVAAAADWDKRAAVLRAERNVRLLAAARERAAAPPYAASSPTATPSSASKPDAWRKFVRAPVVEEAWVSVCVGGGGGGGGGGGQSATEGRSACFMPPPFLSPLCFHRHGSQAASFKRCAPWGDGCCTFGVCRPLRAPPPGPPAHGLASSLTHLHPACPLPLLQFLYDTW